MLTVKSTDSKHISETSHEREMLVCSSVVLVTTGAYTIGRHSMTLHTYTATYIRIYTLTQLHTYLHSLVHTYIHILKVVCEGIRTYTSMHTGPWEHDTYL